MCKQTSEVSEGRQDRYSKRLPIPLSCLTRAVLSSSNFPPRKSIFRVRLTGNKINQEKKTGNSSLLCSHNRDKLNTSVSQFWVSAVFSDKDERKLQESQLIQMVFKTERCCLFLTKSQICFWSLINNYSLKSRWIEAKYLPSRFRGSVNILKATIPRDWNE